MGLVSSVDNQLGHQSLGLGFESSLFIGQLSNYCFTHPERHCGVDVLSSPREKVIKLSPSRSTIYCTDLTSLLKKGKGVKVYCLLLGWKVPVHLSQLHTIPSWAGLFQHVSFSDHLRPYTSVQSVRCSCVNDTSYNCYLCLLLSTPFTPGWDEAVVYRRICPTPPCHDRDSNSRPCARESSVLSTQPRHPQYEIINKILSMMNLLA